MARQPEPTVEQYAAGARKLASFGSLLISLAGGEPLLRDDLPELIRAVGEYHFPFVTTNGWRMRPDLARRIMKAGVWGVSVSIDYARADRHDERRGRKGAWTQAWKAVEYLSAARAYDYQRVNVIAVLMDDNLDDLPLLLDMAARRKAYFMVQPYSVCKTGSTDYAHNDGRVSPLLLKMRRDWGNFLSNPYYLGRFDEFLSGGVGRCLAGRAFFNIDSTGDVAICVERRSRPVANIYRDNAAVIHQRLRAATRGNTCRACWYNCRGEIESLYHPYGLVRSLPTLLFDRGAAPDDRRAGG